MLSIMRLASRQREWQSEMIIKRQQIDLPVMSHARRRHLSLCRYENVLITNRTHRLCDLSAVDDKFLTNAHINHVS